LKLFSAGKTKELKSDQHLSFRKFIFMKKKFEIIKLSLKRYYNERLLNEEKLRKNGFLMNFLFQENPLLCLISIVIFHEFYFFYEKLLNYEELIKWEKFFTNG
jgi:hypothetical protein